MRYKYLPHIGFAVALFWTVLAVRREDAAAETVVAVVAWLAWLGLVVGRFIHRRLPRS